ncbi:Nn.00g081180.m01.CDS01 [Neocucurbitaria sp. VM-36]
MTSNTPDNLLRLASELSKLGAELASVGGKLAAAATTLEQEAANIALENSKRWGVDVQVAVRAGPYGTPGSVIEMKK